MRVGAYQRHSTGVILGMKLIENRTDYRDAITVAWSLIGAGVLMISFFENFVQIMVLMIAWAALAPVSPLVPSWLPPLLAGGTTAAGCCLLVLAHVLWDRFQ